MTRATLSRSGLAMLALFAAACSSGDETAAPYRDYAGLVANSLGIGRAAAPAPLEMPTGAMPVEVLAQSPGPMIALTVAGAQRIVLSAAPDAGDEFLNFQDQNRRGLRLRGGAVAGTYGFGQDLLAVRYQREDPVAHPLPLEEWPGQVDREYQYRLRDLANFSITVTCVFDRVVRENIDVIERHETVRIVETCTNSRRSFENTYWVEPLTGVIRRSQQWTGPEIRPVIIELLRPRPAA
ncbi:YjbF family lipoprotein [Limibaculum sp. FT325]|uniref:YjbF family lipoprotein n=1 Tax=Thermohalobaculum sediminis TaxID=2939436 RepID=UPI0020C0B8BA|nr:YjbF family lipoprotein [Limibaculum sediminis]MCL5777809.1 YjbF family lipoprotein [Limibaculum sediminis]